MTEKYVQKISTFITYMLVPVNQVYKGLVSVQVIVKKLHPHQPTSRFPPGNRIHPDSFFCFVLFLHFILASPSALHMHNKNSAMWVCGERKRATRISSCISKVHFHSRAALRRGSVGPLWQLCLPAGVEMKQGLFIARPAGSGELESQGEGVVGGKRRRAGGAGGKQSSWGCRCVEADGQNTAVVSPRGANQWGWVGWR